MSASTVSEFLRVPDLTETCEAPADPAITYTFPLDPFQRWAIAAIHREENVLVTAKTGSGKTLVAEYGIAHALREGRRVFYTTPIKSLSNQKYHDLKHLFPYASVGILTGDIKCNPDAQIVVMTTEILRNLLFKRATATASLGIAGAVQLDGVGLFVFDEVHYINDRDRGHVWEESLLLTPPHIRLILLSATIDAPEALAAWIGGVHRVPCWLLKTTYRIVPLVHQIYTEGLRESLVLKDRDEAPVALDVYRDWLRRREARADDAAAWKKTVRDAQRAGESAAGREGKVKAVSIQHQINECVETLRTKDLLPALFFCFSRKECERWADKISVPDLLTSSEVADVKHILSFHLHRYAHMLETLPQYHQVVRLLERGVAFHHSGVLPLLKEIIELLFARGFVRVLFATETFAVGLNMPTRTVVFTDLKKPDDGSGFRPLRYDEYAQMSGRAGRRGKDVRGHVFYLPTRDPLGIHEISPVMAGALVPLTSRIQFHYDFVLKVLHGSVSSDQSDAFSHILEKSYWWIQHQEALAIQRSDVAITEAALTSLAAKLTADQRSAFAERDRLEQVARTTQNAKQKAARLGLKRWLEEHEGTVWKIAEKTWITEQQTRATWLQQKAGLAESESVGIAERVGPVLKALQEWEYLQLEDVGEGDVKRKNGTLTHRGILATEVNEGNPVLMTELYLSGLLRDATATEIVQTLAAFVVDRDVQKRCTEDPEGYDWGVTEGVLARAAAFLKTTARRGVILDRQYGVASPETFWDIAPFWPTLAGAWMEGAEAGVLTRDHALFDGNFMRGILKIYNLVEEWQSMATFCGDVAMLDRLREVPQTLLRGVVQPESLYLRL